MDKNNQQTRYLSTSDVAKIMGISRTAIFKKIKGGNLRAQKIGRNYAITREDLENALGKTVTPAQSKEIEHVVKQAVKKYHETFRKLGEK